MKNHHDATPTIPLAASIHLHRDSRDGNVPATPINSVVNWLEELKQRVSVR